MLALALLVLVPAAALLAGPLRILELGDDAAAGLGVRVGASPAGHGGRRRRTGRRRHGGCRARGLRRVPRRPHRAPLRRARPLPASALVGALIVLAADYVAANIAPLLLDGTVLPVGVVTGALGAPFLLWLLVTSNRKDA